MSKELKRLYDQEDDRAVFLRAYFVMTTQVNAAVHGTGEFKRVGPIFFDPDWVDRVAGRFAHLYFESLERSRASAKPICKAWGLAMEMATRQRTSVMLNLLLGINAHINFDLALGIHESLQRELLAPRGLEDSRERERQRMELLARRKFDHDQLNNVLVNSLPKIQRVLGREFGGGLGLLSRLLGMYDEFITLSGLRYYRDRVWHNVLGFLSTRSSEDSRKVRLRLEWESHQMARFIIKGGWLNEAVYSLDTRLRRRSIQGRFRPDLDGSSHEKKRMDFRLQRPF
ncbi:hypothetical protein JQX13_18760 [Archangium violaceum]|uniref:DUF5995 family protein n=1 Tax=Archangium violaceum TaxID=83451 RepID=UPI00193BA4D8|nr:DUF5995 family protein [Archangium violaceum]QRK11913.1 hypothetical protein JQX13_18760 [Archangium violaceum]